MKREQTFGNRTHNFTTKGTEDHPQAVHKKVPKDSFRNIFYGYDMFFPQKEKVQSHHLDINLQINNYGTFQSIAFSTSVHSDSLINL